MICYFIRVVEGFFDSTLFEITREQRTALNSILDRIAIFETKASRTSHASDSLDTNIDEENEENNETVKTIFVTEIDEYIFQLLVALIKHRTARTFDSAITSFCAVRAASIHGAGEAATISWRPEGEVSGIFSKLIYCCQLIILQHATHIAAAEHASEITNALETLASQWIRSHSRGPLSTMNDWRLYAMRVGATTVPPALVIWDADGESLTYNDVRYEISNLADEIIFCLREARTIFMRDLFVNAAWEDIPTFDLMTLQDNWSSRFPGYSFVDDTRNAATLEPYQNWLVGRLTRDPDALEGVFACNDDMAPVSEWRVRNTFATQISARSSAFSSIFYPQSTKAVASPLDVPNFSVFAGVTHP